MGGRGDFYMAKYRLYKVKILLISQIKTKFIIKSSELRPKDQKSILKMGPPKKQFHTNNKMDSEQMKRW